MPEADRPDPNPDPAGADPGAGSARCIGRARELATLGQALDDALAGRGRAAVVTGEPGIGKTSLIQDIAAAASARGARVVATRCPASEGAPAYWPWSEVLWACTEGRVRLDLAAVPGPRGAAGLGSDATSHPLGVPLGLGDEAARFALFTQVVDELTTAAHRRPHLLVLDDLHWADTPTLRLFEFVAGQVHRAALLIVGACRDVDVGEQVDGLVAGLPGDAVRIELRPLDREATGRLVASTSGAKPSRSFVAWVHRHSGGNPLFAQEIVRLLMSEGRLGAPPGDVVLPAGVRGVIERRIGGLPSQTIEDLRWAALCGDEVDLDLVAAASGRPRADLAQSLASARRTRLVRRILDGGTERHAFAHGLVAETLRDGLPPDDRSQRHLRVGQALLGASGCSTSAAEVSHHLTAALPHGDAVLAADCATQAADDAVRALAWEEAARHYTRAHQALTGVTGHEVRRTELLVERALAASRVGEGLDPRKFAVDAVEAARLNGPPELLARAALAYSARTFAHGGDATTIALLDEVLRRLPSGDNPLRATLLASLAEEVHYSDRPRFRALAREALAMAERVDDPIATWEALLQMHRLERGDADLAARMATSQRLVLLGEQMQDPERMLLGRTRLVADLMAAGDRPALDQQIAAFPRQADRANLGSLRWWVPLWAGALALADGRLDEAEAHAATALGAADPRGEYAATQAMVLLAGVRFQQERLDEVEPVLASVVDQQPAVPVYRCMLAFVRAELGRLTAAQALLDPLAADGFASVPRDQDWPVALYGIAEASLACGRADWSQTVLELLLPYRDHHIVSSSGGLYCGTVARLLGRLALVGGHGDAADEHFRAAIATSRRFGAALWTAQTTLDWAAGRLAAGRDDADVRGHLVEVADVAGELDLPRLARQLDAVPEPGSEGDAGPTSRHDTNLFRRDGPVWTIEFRGERVQVRDRKGLRDIALLLATPGRELAVGELIAAEGVPHASWGADAVADDEALRRILRELDDLRTQADEAAAWHDDERAVRLQADIQARQDYLRSVRGLGRRPRLLDSAVERDRKRVWRRIHTSIAALRAGHPRLAHHLEHSICTGAFCSYVPDEPVTWVVR